MKQYTFKQQINFRASDLTAKQLDALMSKWGTSQTETLTVVIDRIYQSEMEKEKAMTKAKVNSKTTLTQIKQMMDDDFGAVIDNDTAKEVKEDCLHGMTIWTEQHYVSGASNPTLKQVTREGVNTTAYGTYYTMHEWNTEKPY